MFNEDILINRNALEEECSSAPAHFDYWQTRESNLKSDLENHEATLALDIRSCNEYELEGKYGISKITDAAVNAVIKNNQRYKILRRDYLHAEARRKSYEKKIQMLDVLAKLHGQGYFSKIESKKDTMALLAKNVRKKIEEQIKKRSAEKPSRPKRNG